MGHNKPLTGERTLGLSTLSVVVGTHKVVAQRVVAHILQPRMPVAVVVVVVVVGTLQLAVAASGTHQQHRIVLLAAAVVGHTSGTAVSVVADIHQRSILRNLPADAHRTLAGCRRHTHTMFLYVHRLVSVVVVNDVQLGSHGSCGRSAQTRSWLGVPVPPYLQKQSAQRHNRAVSLSLCLLRCRPG